MEYEIKFHPEALKEFSALDGSVKKLVKKQLDKLKTSPLLGEELGNKNGFDLTGYRKMYACKKQVRIVYSVVENVLLVNIIAIGKREDLEVYESASQRV
ncbi:MAG: type II toxin-antitoxin system RelE/ParE family toxin [Treponema sp.]|nr:type II toxin-antitoxin system RelE/ParE family toxin [Treponema sp.]MBR6294859.1 type II toxin-antitoxin system RelE/ParE family toxin [Treponema sp.]MEE3313673.1 type II toxin-antitoxin system RelE/ParE family toxin [Treponema sp.]